MAGDAELADRLAVLQRRVSDIGLPAITGISGRQTAHDPIACDLCDHRSGSNREAERVSFDDGLHRAGNRRGNGAVVKGDALSFSIAAASVVAKVTRDRIMRGLAPRYPGYGWETNVGYATLEHGEAIHRLGITRHHRRSFAPVRLANEGDLPLFATLAAGAP